MKADPPTHPLKRTQLDESMYTFTTNYIVDRQALYWAPMMVSR